MSLLVGMAGAFNRVFGYRPSSGGLRSARRLSKLPGRRPATLKERRMERELKAAQKTEKFRSEVASAFKEIAEAEETARKMNSQLKSKRRTVKFTLTQTQQIREAIDAEEKIISFGSDLNTKLSRKGNELLKWMGGKNAEQISEAIRELNRVESLSGRLTEKIVKARESLERNKGLLRVAESESPKRASARQTMNVLLSQHRQLQREITNEYQKVNNVERSMRRRGFTELQRSEAARTAIEMHNSLARRCETFIGKLGKELRRPGMGKEERQEISNLIKQYEKQMQIYERSVNQHRSFIGGSSSGISDVA